MNWDDLGDRALFERATAVLDPGTPFEEIRVAVRKSSRWDDSYEWRIFTYGTERIERVAKGFRAVAEMNGRFRADFATLDEACEALRVLSWLGKALFYALHWTTNGSTPALKLEPDRDAAEAYFKRVAKDAESRPSSTYGSIVIAPPPADWNDAPDRIYVVAVRRESLVLECDCTTPERADLFLAVFDALADDLLEILEWKPLPATD